MSQARMSMSPDENGMYRVWCDPCDSEATFQCIADAILARRLHLCEGEVPSAAWPGWALGLDPDVSS